MNGRRSHSPTRMSVQQFGKRMYLVNTGKASWYRPRYSVNDAWEKAGLGEPEEVTYEKISEPNAGI
jgi:hypothetical protein